jgi:hypothetical protein
MQIVMWKASRNLMKPSARSVWTRRSRSRCRVPIAFACSAFNTGEESSTPQRVRTYSPTHSVLFFFRSAQSKTCPICRAKIECSEGSDLYQFTHHEVRDLGSYATDLVARIFEFLEKRDRSDCTEDAIRKSAEIYAAASSIKCAPLSKLLQTELLPRATLSLGLSSLIGRVTVPAEVDSDFMLALELSSGEDQFAAFRQYEQLQRDQVLAMALAMEVDDSEMEPHADV